MSKRLIIGISVALVLVGAVVLTVLIVRSRSLTDAPVVTVDGTPATDGTGDGGLGSSSQNGGTPQDSGTDTTVAEEPQAGPCGDGVCSAGESWCKPDCGDKEERFQGSLKTEATSTTLKIVWKTDTASTGDVRYGQTDRYEIGSVSTTGAAKEQSVTLRNLSPGTTYLLHVHVTEEDGTVHDAGPLNVELP